MLFIRDDPSYFHCFSVFTWTGENCSNTLRVDAFEFENGEKIVSFQNTGRKMDLHKVAPFQFVANI